MQRPFVNVTPFSNPLVRLLSESRFRWLRHTLFIGGGLILAFKEDMSIAEKYHAVPAAVRAIFYYDTFLFLSIMGLLYFNLLVLIPQLLFRSRMLLFGLSFIILVFLMYLCSWWLDSIFLKPVFPASMAMPHSDLSFGNFIEKGLIIGILVGSVTGMKVFQKWIKDVKRMNELHETNLKTELEQLKSQVNPHFLFNTLNNLLVLVKTDQDKAAQVLLGLSDLLRYQLYDSAKEKITLVKDIAFIRNLLALEKIRKEDFSFNVETEGQLEGVMLPPFLFIPFVENAVKHGASTVGHSYFKASFRLTREHLYFYAENSKPAIRHSQHGGIGLKNIRRRLELLYPGTHELEIREDDRTYIVNLKIPL